MSNAERICVKCNTSKQTGDTCTVCSSPLTLARVYEAVRETHDALDARAHEVRDRRTGALSVLVKLPLDPVSPRIAARLDERMRTWRTGDPEGSVALVKLVRLSDEGDSVQLYLVRMRARGAVLDSKRRLENDEACEMARAVLSAIAAAQRNAPTFRHGAITAENIVANDGGYLLGPPSFSPAMLTPNAEGARADVAQLADLVRTLVTLESGDVAESWKRWLARASGRGEAPYRDAKAALAGLTTVKEKARSDRAWQPKNRETSRHEDSPAKSVPNDADRAVVPAVNNSASPGGTPNAKRKKKRRQLAEEAATGASTASSVPKASDPSADAKAEAALASRAWTAGVFLVLGVACLAWEMLAMGS